MDRNLPARIPNPARPDEQARGKRKSVDRARCIDFQGRGYFDPEVERLEGLGGENIEVAPGEEKIKLVISSNRIDDLARLSGVRYIEKVPEFKLSPTYIKKRGK